jgi:hypothetical protein
MFGIFNPRTHKITRVIATEHYSIAAVLTQLRHLTGRVAGYTHTTTSQNNSSRVFQQLEGKEPRRYGV